MCGSYLLYKFVLAIATRPLADIWAKSKSINNSGNSKSTKHWKIYISPNVLTHLNLHESAYYIF